MADAISVFKDAYTVSEKFRDLELKKAMQALEVKILDVQQENTKLREENTRLNKLLNARDDLKPFGPHNYFYKNGQTDGPYCPKCWQKDQRQVLLPASENFAAGLGKQCTVCDKLYIEQPAKPIQPVIAIGSPLQQFGRGRRGL